MVQLLLNPDLPYQSLLDLAARERGLLNFLDSYLNSSGFMPRELDFTVRAFSQISLPCLDELEVVFFYARKKLLESPLLWGETALVVSLFDERG